MPDEITMRWSCPDCPQELVFANTDRDGAAALASYGRQHAEREGHTLTVAVQVDPAAGRWLQVGPPELDDKAVESMVQRFVSHMKRLTEAMIGGSDYLELGTPKLGVFKIRGDYEDPRAFKAKVDAAMEILAYAKDAKAEIDKKE